MSDYATAFQILCPCAGGRCDNKCACTHPDCKCAQRNLSQTTYCASQLQNMNVIQDNTVDYRNQDQHAWSNIRGYGNIVVSTVNASNQVVGRVSPYNRIPAMPLPVETSVDPVDAWSSKKQC